MQRVFISIFAVLTLAIFLSACGGGEESNLSTPAGPTLEFDGLPGDVGVTLSWLYDECLSITYASPDIVYTPPSHHFSAALGLETHAPQPIFTPSASLPVETPFESEEAEAAPLNPTPALSDACEAFCKTLGQVIEGEISGIIYDLDPKIKQLGVNFCVTDLP